MNDQTQQRRIRLVLLDSHGLFRACLGRLLASEPDLEVAGECATCAEALEVLKASTVDVLLLDFDVGTEHGNDFIPTARQAGYQGQFLIVAGSADVRSSAIALKLGASGIFLNSESPDRLVQAIRLVGNGGIWVDQRIIRLLAEQLVDYPPPVEDQKSSDPLEDRERSVLLGILEGLTNRKIGDSPAMRIANVVEPRVTPNLAKRMPQILGHMAQPAPEINALRLPPRALSTVFRFRRSPRRPAGQLSRLDARRVRLFSGGDVPHRHRPGIPQDR
jgi:two-component system, NarL family, response regulator DevR